MYDGDFAIEILVPPFASEFSAKMRYTPALGDPEIGQRHWSMTFGGLTALAQDIIDKLVMYATEAAQKF